MHFTDANPADDTPPYALVRHCHPSSSPNRYRYRWLLVAAQSCKTNRRDVRRSQISSQPNLMGKKQRQCGRCGATVAFSIGFGSGRNVNEKMHSSGPDDDSPSSACRSRGLVCVFGKQKAESGNDAFSSHPSQPVTRRDYMVLGRARQLLSLIILAWPVGRIGWKRDRSWAGLKTSV